MLGGINMAGVKDVLQEIEKAMEDTPAYVKGVKAVFQFNLSGEEEGIYQLVIRDEGELTIYEGEQEKADCTLLMSSQDFVKMARGKLNGTQAFMTGRLKVKGNIGLALKLQGILASYNKERSR